MDTTRQPTLPNLTINQRSKTRYLSQKLLTSMNNASLFSKGNWTRQRKGKTIRSNASNGCSLCSSRNKGNGSYIFQRPPENAQVDSSHEYSHGREVNEPRHHW